MVVRGSEPLLAHQGLTESLAGRFELLRVPHWSFEEMREAIGWGVERYVLFGGYPGAAPLVDEPARWAAYVRDALVETTLSHDVLLMSGGDKPALLRQLFDYAGEVVRQRASSPKLCVPNTALATSRAGGSPDRLRADPVAWGRLVESCVGAHLLDTALEVKSAFSAPPRGLAVFQKRYPRARALVVGAGSGAIPLGAFLERPAAGWGGPWITHIDADGMRLTVSFTRPGDLGVGSSANHGENSGRTKVLPRVANGGGGGSREPEREDPGSRGVMEGESGDPTKDDEG